jgi:hypothetical protein
MGCLFGSGLGRSQGALWHSGQGTAMLSKGPNWPPGFACFPLHLGLKGVSAQRAHQLIALLCLLVHGRRAQQRRRRQEAGGICGGPGGVPGRQHPRPHAHHAADLAALPRGREVSALVQAAGPGPLCGTGAGSSCVHVLLAAVLLPAPVVRGFPPLFHSPTATKNGSSRAPFAPCCFSAWCSDGEEESMEQLQIVLKAVVKQKKQQAQKKSEALLQVCAPAPLPALQQNRCSECCSGAVLGPPVRCTMV